MRDGCLRDVDSSDVYVLILSYRYGFQPVDDNPDRLSIAHLEFQRAERFPRIALIRTSMADTRTSEMFEPDRIRLVLAFHEEVRRRVRVAEFTCSCLPALFA